MQALPQSWKDRRWGKVDRGDAGDTQFTARVRRKEFALLVDRTSPSSFAHELLNGGYDVKNIGRRLDDGNPCPNAVPGSLKRNDPALPCVPTFRTAHSQRQSAA